MDLLEIPPQSLLVKPYKHPPLSIRPKAISYFGLNPSKTSSFPPLRRFGGIQPFSCLGAIQPTSRLNLSASAIDPLVPELEEEDTPPYKKEKRGVVVKPTEKPRVVLKFIWMQKVIGIALDQVIAGHGTIPLSPYYFWPKVDAWEQLKVLLESKPWISRKQLYILLNQATDVINLWQENAGHL